MWPRSGRHARARGGLTAVAVVVTLLAALGRARAADGILVVAPHPDDEVLAAGGVLSRGLAGGADVHVVVVTNGDYHGVQIGPVREGETVDGLAALGIEEARVIFLGYPDAGLLPLWNNAPLDGQAYLSPYSGRLSTYGTRGLGGRDFHTVRTGVAGAYNRPTLVADVAAALDLVRPSEIFVTGPEDQHPDHRGTFYAVRDAVRMLAAADASFRPTIYVTTIHDPLDWPFDDFWPATAPREMPPLRGNDDVWPNPSLASGVPNRFQPDVPFVMPPSLPRTGVRWSDRISRAVPPAMTLIDFAANLKIQSLQRYVTQASPVLWAHVKSDEFFWTAPVRLGTFTTNVARAASLTASSGDPRGAADGVVDGAPVHPAAEWAAAVAGAGATLRLAWRAPEPIDRVILHDRVSLTDRVTAGRLVLDDGTVVPTGPLANDGRGDEFVLPTAHTVGALSFVVDAAVGRPGLAEIEVFGAPIAGTCADGCDDGNPCTADRCTGAACVHEPFADGTSCGDDDPCNGVEECRAGACTRLASPGCDDHDPCTRDLCGPAGGCVHEDVCQPVPARGRSACRLGVVGVPSRPCMDGDPACDRDGATDGGCRFDVIVCLNVGASTPGCSPMPVADIELGRQAQAFGDVAAALRSRLPSDDRVCAGPAPVTVKLQGRRGRLRAPIRVALADHHVLHTSVRLVCRAAPRGKARHRPAPLVP